LYLNKKKVLDCASLLGNPSMEQK